MPGHLEVEQVAAELEAMPANQSSPAVIAKGEQALQELEHEVGSDLWVQLHLRLAALLLELPGGNQVENFDRARGHYRAVLEYARRAAAEQITPQRMALVWLATSGLANTLAWHPQADRQTLELAFALYAELESHYRRLGDAESLAEVLGNDAQAHTKAAKLWGTDEELEQALSLQQEAVDVLSTGPAVQSIDTLVLGRAYHNLGAIYMERRRDARSQNVDFAVRAFQSALALRSASADPVGRVRTLRALSLAYPEWMGADSLAHGAALGVETAAEADWLQQSDARLVGRTQGWAAFTGQQSALFADLEWLDEETALPREWFESIIANHQQAVNAIPRDVMPVRWAEWAAGLGRLLAKLTRFDRRNAPKAYQCFDAALAVIDPANHTRLWREIQRRYGELAHEIGDWATTARAFSAALGAADRLFDAAGAAETRNRELADSRGFALFAANAAARLGDLDEAVRLAEHGRSRTLVDAIAATDAMLAAAPPDLRASAIDARNHVAALERQLRDVETSGGTAVMNEIRAKLADFAMVDPRVLNVRLARGGVLDDRKPNADYARVSAELGQARVKLREALSRARGGATETVLLLDAAGVRAIAGRSGYPIVYLLPTTYGLLTIVVPPTGPIEAIDAPETTSADTRALVYGSEGRPGFLRAMAGDEDALAAAIEPCLARIRTAVMSPLAAWLRGHGFDRAALAPLGSLGLLPIHAAGPVDGPSFGYVPSARAWSLALELRDRTRSAPARLVAIAEPAHTGTGILPLARAEVHAAGTRFPSDRPAAILAGPQATLASVRAEIGRATHLHFACHGVFRPSDPRASALLLAGEDQLTLGQLFDGGWTLPNVKLAVLSACQTAVSEFHRTPDESAGFPSALLLAGIPGIVGTLWPIDDTATALFCDRFYELYLEGDDACAAVAGAQRWLAAVRPAEARNRAAAMRDRIGQDAEDFEHELNRWLEGSGPDDRPFASPDLWAGFCYVGA